MKSKILQVGTLSFLLIFCLVISSGYGEETSLTLIYSSNTLGQVEPSCCPEPGIAGGIARRASYIKTVREEASNLLILDGGNALALDSFDNKNERGKVRKRAELVLRIYEKIGYGALNIGYTDLALGVDYLKALHKKSKIPFLSSNFRDKKTRMPIFNPYLVKDIDGFKIGIIGLLSSNIDPKIQKEMKNFFIEDPIKAATQTINSLMPECNLMIALAHLAPSEIESLTKTVPEVSIIIGGQERSLMFAKKMNRSIVVQTDAYGIHIGRLNLRLVKESSEFVDIQPLNLIQKNIDQVEKKIGDTRDSRDMENLKELLAKLIEQKNRLPDPKDKNTYENVLPVLHSDIRDDPEVRRMISPRTDHFKKSIP